MDAFDGVSFGAAGKIINNGSCSLDEYHTLAAKWQSASWRSTLHRFRSPGGRLRLVDHQIVPGGDRPGLMIATALVITWWLVSRRDNDVQLSPKASGKERLKALADSTWALLLPVIIVVGLRFGIVTPTEAGAVASVYALLVSSLIYRELSLKSLSELLLRAGKTTAAVMFLVAAASIPAWMITIADIPEQIIDLIQPLMDNPKLLIVVLMLLILLILLISMVMDLTPTILLLAPILVPVVTAANIDPIYFGVLFMINCSSGLITSPVGTVLNVVCGIGNMRYEALLKGTVPFLIAETIVLFLLVIFPDLVTVPARWFAH